MKQPPHELAITFALALLAGAACTPKHDTANPDGGKGACTEEAKVCADGSSVSRSGPDCEFAACPGEGDGEGDKPVPEGDAPDGDAPRGDAPEGEAAPASDGQ
jgi:hypothetical protein